MTKCFIWQDRQNYLLLFHGASVGINSFRGVTFAGNLRKDTNQYILKNILTVTAYPITLVISIAGGLEAFWFDPFYAGFVY